MVKEIIQVKGTNIIDARLDFAAEVSRILLTREQLGRDIFMSLQSEDEREAFITGQITVLYDYLTARQEGRITEPRIEAVIKKE